MAKIIETDNGTAVNLISQGTEITGDVKSTGDVRIDGVLNGNMVTKGKVVVGPTGRVKGEVECKNSEVSGLVEGKLTVTQLLILKASSKINGTIVTDKLSIEPGALFTGNCSMKDGENGGTTAKPKEGEK
ncbi:MAG: polymer-forming cytoskeletal protein [Bacteroidales bacterium]|jgi:cytoskeletal protein CcmA (bactofilin family)|nr:polymer-forming cytoskeletal protein [Bacteroidales bacterium]